MREAGGVVSDFSIRHLVTDDYRYTHDTCSLGMKLELKSSGFNH